MSHHLEATTNNNTDVPNATNEEESTQSTVAPTVLGKRRFTAAEVSTLRDFHSRGMRRSGDLFDQCVSALDVPPKRVKNWIANNSRSSASARVNPGTSAPIPPSPPPPESSLPPAATLFKPARGRKPSIRDIFQKEAGKRLRDSGTLKGGQGSIAQVNALATELQQSASVEELENARNKVVQVAAEYAANDVQRMENAERQKHVDYHRRMMNKHSKACAQLGLSSVVITIDMNDRKMDLVTHGAAASDFESKFEEVAGCQMTTVLAASTVGTAAATLARSQNDTLTDLRKKVQVKMLEAINSYLVANQEPEVVKLPISILEAKCPFRFAEWPTVTLNPSKMRTCHARSVMSQSLEVISCECHP